ncbi:MAG: hypothetical protein ABFS23_07215 [Pseudomonadota bacterium]
MTPENQMPEPAMDADNLYLEEVFTDQRVGTIRRLTPVQADGSPDSARAVIYAGQAQLMTSMGALPINFEIKASSLEQAVAGFGDAAKVAIESAMKDIQEMRREAASSIIVPEAGGVGPGGVGGGGKIQMP